MATKPQRRVREEGLESKRFYGLDRLHAVIVGLAALMVFAGCDNGEKKARSRPARGRVNAVKAKQKKEKVPPPEAFCDVYLEDDAPEFHFPELEDDPPASAGGWRWVNVWATWCGPCVEEMPRITAWREKLSKHGLGELVLVSADESRKTVETFRKKHPDTPSSLLMTSPDGVKPWLKSLGLETGAPLPIHLFVDPAGKFRCLRAGGIAKGDFSAIKRLLEGE